LLGLIAAMSDAIAGLEAERSAVFDQHQQPAAGPPGLDPVLDTRVRGEPGDDPHRFTDAAGLRST